MLSYKKISVGGFHKQSLIDYPGNISALIFTCGCNFRCNYCHNPELVYPKLIEKTTKIDNEEIFDWLSRNMQMLDAVVITGGEPTLHASLPEFIRQIKKYNMNIKLDTNGTNPDMLEKLLSDNLIDYVAMDIKAPLVLWKYKKVVGNIIDAQLMNKVLRSVKLLNESHIHHEFRTTIDENLSLEDFESITGKISGNYFIQNKLNINNTDSYNISSKKQDEILNIIANKNPNLRVKMRG